MDEVAAGGKATAKTATPQGMDWPPRILPVAKKRLRPASAPTAVKRLRIHVHHHGARHDGVLCTVRQNRSVTRVLKQLRKITGAEGLQALFTAEGYRLWDDAEIWPLIDQDSVLVAVDKQTAVQTYMGPIISMASLPFTNACVINLPRNVERKENVEQQRRISGTHFQYLPNPFDAHRAGERKTQRVVEALFGGRAWHIHNSLDVTQRKQQRVLKPRRMRKTGRRWKLLELRRGHSLFKPHFCRLMQKRMRRLRIFPLTCKK